MVSFQRITDTEGWRYSLSYRTRRAPWFAGGGMADWPVERWDGEAWVSVGTGSSYADARRVATNDQASRAAV